MHNTNEPIKLLLIEDDSVDRIFFQRALKASDIISNLTVTEDAVTGIDAFCKEDFSCVFLDYMLPGTDGLNLLKSLNAKKPGIPIVIVTSHGDEKIAVDAMKAGAMDYISKDLITHLSLAQTIRGILRFKEIERQKISAENIVRQNERRHRIFFEKSQIFLCTHDLEGNFINVNMAGARSLGYTPEEMIGTNLKNIVSPPHMHLFNSYLNRILEEKTTMGLLRVLTKANEERIWMYHNYLYEESDNQENYVIGSIQDITERVKMEEEMQAAKLLAEESVKIKEQFLANMSHEIRTPMSAIIGFTNLILETKLSGEQKEYVDIIHHSGQHLLSTINDILDFSKIRSGKLLLEETDFDLSRLVAILIQTFQPEATKKNIDLICSIDANVPVLLKGDSVRLNQILLNLFSNAIKFTEAGSVRLEIQLLNKEKELNTIAFSVEDTGIGILPNKLETVFENFTQASADTTRKYGGTGLGLSIVKNLVEIQGGKITASNNPGRGTSFKFTIDIKSGSQVPGNNHLPNEQKNPKKRYCDLTGTRILLVEDNSLNQLLAKRVLHKMHAAVDIVENGREAIEKLKTSTYDVVLMDIQMPEMDGYDATRHIRTQLPEGPNKIPIIAMTAHALNDEGSKCILAGMNDYISKPFEPYSLGTKIKNLVTGSVKVSFDEIDSDCALALVEEKNEEIMNLSVLKNMLGNDDKVLLEALVILCKELTTQAENIKSSAENKNWKQLSQDVHKMRSSIKILGMPHFLSVVELTEKNAGSETAVETLPVLVKEILLATSRAISDVNRELLKLRSAIRTVE